MIKEDIIGKYGIVNYIIPGDFAGRYCQLSEEIKIETSKQSLWFVKIIATTILSPQVAVRINMLKDTYTVLGCTCVVTGANIGHKCTIGKTS